MLKRILGIVAVQQFIKFVKQQMYEWGWKGVTSTVMVAGLTVVISVSVIAPELGADTTPTSSDATVIKVTQVVPTTGDAGFPVAVFCHDENVTVTPGIVPDAGVAYQLVRTVDGVTETVRWLTFEGREATHYWDVKQPDGSFIQDSEPAFVDDAAKKCIEEKAD